MTKRTERGRRPSVEPLEGRALMTAGALDTSFGGTGIVTHDFGSSLGNTQPVAIQPWDGKVIVALRNTAESNFQLTRFNPDGSLDTTFGQNGLATVTFGSGTQFVTAVVADPTSHDLYAVGDRLFNGEIALARFTPSGALDSTFGKGGEVTVAAAKPYNFSGAVTATIDPSGRLVVGGNTSGSSGSVGFIDRFTTTGTLDKTFNSTGKLFGPLFGTSDGWNTLQIEPSGSSYQIAAAGIYDGHNAMAMYSASGTSVTSFGTNGVAALDTNPNAGTDPGPLYRFLPDGHLVELQQINGASSTTAFLNRYNPDGSLDVTFGTGGQAQASFPPGFFWAVAVDLSGRIVLGGWSSGSSSGSDGLLARFTSTGAIDTSFGVGGVVTQAIGPYGTNFRALAIYPAGTSHAGEILAAGTTETVPPPSPYAELALALYQSDPAATTTTVASSLDPSNAGDAVTFTATVSTAGPIAPTGTVSFYDGTTLLGTGTIVLINGVATATFTTSTLTAGSHSITAVYGGDADDQASTSASLVQVINA